MDSFFEQPRSVPIPRVAQEVLIAPVVPEVSMISQKSVDDGCSTADSIYLTYSAWKARDQNKNDKQFEYCADRLKKCGTSSAIDYKRAQDLLKKQVRFESPILPQQKSNSPVQVLPNSIKYSSQKVNDKPCSRQSNYTDLNEPLLLPKSNHIAKPFEEIYMANIPHRKLDLSIFDVPSKPNQLKENINPNLDNQIVNQHQLAKNSNDFAFSKEKIMHKESEYKPRNFQIAKTYSEIKKNAKPDLPKTNGTRMNDAMEKNYIIDLHNYKSNDPSKFPFALHQVLDNTKLDQNDYRTIASKNSDRFADATNPYALYNYSHSKQSENYKSHPKNHQCDAVIQTEMIPSLNPTNNNVETCQKQDDEPTVKELLKIIQQQNQQLIILQKQVSALLNNNRDAPKQIEAPPQVNTNNVNLFAEKYQTSTQLESQDCLYNPTSKCIPQKRPLQKFALDVMTSFEVSIRRPQNLNRMCKNIPDHQPKIWEVTEVDSNAFSEAEHAITGPYTGKTSDDTLKSGEISLSLNEPVRVPQTCPTPERSIQIDMEDFSSDSDQEECVETTWTFYNNVLGQVNKILKKSGIRPTNSVSPASSNASNDLFKGNVMKEVKAATIKHLKSIGVHVPSVDEDFCQQEPNNGMAIDRNNISFAVKQLLMKYLPAEQLAKVACTQSTKAASQNSREKAGLIKRRPEFSFATVQYMQKYNLLTDVANGQHVRQPVIEEKLDCNKILDITAIKQQPKLL